jgi:hypothetical protein
MVGKPKAEKKDKQPTITKATVRELSEQELSEQDLDQVTGGDAATDAVDRLNQLLNPQTNGIDVNPNNFQNAADSIAQR